MYTTSAAQCLAILVLPSCVLVGPLWLYGSRRLGTQSHRNGFLEAEAPSPLSAPLTTAAVAPRSVAGGLWWERLLLPSSFKQIWDLLTTAKATEMPHGLAGIAEGCGLSCPVFLVLFFFCLCQAQRSERALSACHTCMSFELLGLTK